MNHFCAGDFATGFVAGMAFMALAVICFVSVVRHLLYQTKSGPIGSQDPQQPIGRSQGAS